MAHQVEGRHYATGRRKSATARVWIMPGDGTVTVNKKNPHDYFKRGRCERLILKPLETVDMAGKMDVMCTVRGGGQTGQAGAVMHGISRALQTYDPSLRPALKKAGLLTRDSRVKERKKPGQPGARKRFQFSKR